MLLHPSFVTLIFALSAFGASVKRGATQVEKDIQNLEAETNSLDESIKAFPNTGGTLVEAMAIHDKADALGSAIQNATADLTASPAFTDSQSNTIAGEIESLGSTVKTTLSDLVNKKPALAAIYADPIVEDDLMMLQKDSQAFGTELMAKISSSVASTVQKDIDDMDNELEAAKEVYAT